jgi:hypothetical protein
MLTLILVFISKMNDDWETEKSAFDEESTQPLTAPVPFAGLANNLSDEDD